MAKDVNVLFLKLRDLTRSQSDSIGLGSVLPAGGTVRLDENTTLQHYTRIAYTQMHITIRNFGLILVSSPLHIFRDLSPSLPESTALGRRF